MRHTILFTLDTVKVLFTLREVSLPAKVRGDTERCDSAREAKWLSAG